MANALDWIVSVSDPKPTLIRSGDETKDWRAIKLGAIIKIDKAIKGSVGTIPSRQHNMLPSIDQ